LTVDQPSSASDPGRRFDLVLRAARAAVEGGDRPATVAVSGGRVVHVGGPDERWRGVAELTLGEDEILLPGLVDTHVHVNEPGRTHWEGFASATRAALRGGVTTIIDMPLNSLPPTVDVPALEVKRTAADGQCFVDVGFWGGAVPENTADLAPLYEAGVFGFKCFLADSGVAEFPPLTPHRLASVMSELADLDALILVHAEDAEELAGATTARGPRYADFLASRPRRAENAAVSTVVNAARATGCRSHILHLSSADALPLLRAARSEGLRLTAETCPHYLTLAAEGIPDGQTAFKCCPPIREDANRQQLWEGLEDGTVDCVVSDHSPCVAELKHLDTGDFGTAWGGVSSLQVAFPVVWTEAARRGHTITEVATWMAERPAALAGLSRKGAIAAGRDADFAVVAPDEWFTVDTDALEHKNPVSPYAGRELRGVVRSTWLRGQRVTTDAPRGRLLWRGQS